MGLIFGPLALVVVSIFIDHVAHTVTAIFLPAADVVETQVIDHSTVAVPIFGILSTDVSSLPLNQRS